MKPDRKHELRVYCPNIDGRRTTLPRALAQKDRDGQEHSNVVKYKRHCGFEVLYIRG